MIIPPRTRPCDVRICQNNGTLVTSENSFGCNCVEGYTGDRCEIMFDPCSSNPCPNNEICQNENNGYTCSCPVGSNGTHCESSF